MSKEYIKTVYDLDNIDDSEQGELFFMALSVITAECRTGQTPGEVIKELQERRNDVIYKETLS